MLSCGYKEKNWLGRGSGNSYDWLTDKNHETTFEFNQSENDFGNETSKHKFGNKTSENELEDKKEDDILTFCNIDILDAASNNDTDMYHEFLLQEYGLNHEDIGHKFEINVLADVLETHDAYLHKLGSSH